MVRAFVRERNGVSIPFVSPGIHAPISALCRILPFPFVRQTLSCPCGIRSRIFKGHPRHRLVVPTRRIRSILPIPEKVQIILRMIVSRIEKRLELCVGHRIFVDPERLDVHRMIVKASRGILPRILHVDPDVIETFDLDSGYAKIESRLRGSSPYPQAVPRAAWFGRWVRSAEVPLSTHARK